MPIHWDLHGNVNGWGTPLMASLLLPAIATALILPLILIPSLGAIIYAYWIRHRMEHSGTPTSELP